MDKDDAIPDFLDRFHNNHVVLLFDHIDFKIVFEFQKMKRMALKLIYEIQHLHYEQQPKDKITKEQYDNFFKHISHLPGEPFMTLHN